MRKLIIKLLTKIFRTCEYCNSPFVGWNWIYVSVENQKKYDWGNITGKDFHGHECWICSACQDTDYKVKNGLPYFSLNFLYSLLHTVKEISEHTENKYNLIGDFQEGIYDEEKEV